MARMAQTLADSRAFVDQLLTFVNVHAERLSNSLDLTHIEPAYAEGLLDCMNQCLKLMVFVGRFLLLGTF